MNFVIEAPFIIRLLATIIYGSCHAICLIHQMHDASHSSIGYGPTWWGVIGKFTMEWLGGASMTSWHHQHVLGHHVYTNVLGADPDLPFNLEGDLRYIVKRQTWAPLYRYQHIYMPILYGLLGIKFRIQDFTWTFASEYNGAIKVNPLPRSAWINLFASKLFFIFYRLIIPVYFLGLTWATTLAYFLIAEVTTGYYLAFNFQVSHISTAAYFPSGEIEEKNIKDEWAVAQILGSVDYAHGDYLVTFLSGALNYQTVHHLFPSVSQYHYPAIAPIVLDVCKKYKVPFNKLPSFSEALRLHIKYLYDMGNIK